MRRLGGLLVSRAPGPSPATGAVRGAATRTLPSYLSLPSWVQPARHRDQRPVVDTRATLSAWERDDGGWHRVHGPVTVRLGWNGWVPAGTRRQDTGTTPAGKFTMPEAFGNRADPGARLPYRQVDGDDVWPYEPRDPATYNIYQPYAGGTARTGAPTTASGWRPTATSTPTPWCSASTCRAGCTGPPAGSSTSRRGGRTRAGAAGSSCTCSAAATRPAASPGRWTTSGGWCGGSTRPSPRIVIGPTAWVKRLTYLARGAEGAQQLARGGDAHAVPAGVGGVLHGDGDARGGRECTTG